MNEWSSGHRRRGLRGLCEDVSQGCVFTVPKSPAPGRGSTPAVHWITWSPWSLGPALRNSVVICWGAAWMARFFKAPQMMIMCIQLRTTYSVLLILKLSFPGLLMTSFLGTFWELLITKTISLNTWSKERSGLLMFILKIKFPLTGGNILVYQIHGAFVRGKTRVDI